MMVSALPIDVHELLSPGRIEVTRLEFKASWDEKTVGLQVLHTICAFANDFIEMYGGYIVVGVEEEAGLPVWPPRGLSPDKLESIEKWIRGQCNRLNPVYQPVLSSETVEGKQVLVVWAPPSDVRPIEAPVSLDKRSGKAFFIRTNRETRVVRDEERIQLLQLTARVPFDDRLNRNASVEDLQEGRVRAYLRETNSRLFSDPDFRGVCRRLRIVRPGNGKEAPVNAGLMFFTDDPGAWFPGARIEVVQFPGGRGGSVIEEQIFTGPLHVQLRECLGHLRNLSVHHIKKVSDRAESRGWVSFPYPALEEALVNAVYHRGYDLSYPDPTKVYLYPDRIEIISYPGPVPGITLDHLNLDQVPPVPARNRRIGEMLKGLRLVEERGTGIPQIYRAMRENGSPTPRFDFDEKRSYFRVTLPAHPEYTAMAVLRDVSYLKAVGDEQGVLGRLQEAFLASPDSQAIARELIAYLGKEGDFTGAWQVLETFSGGEPAHLPLFLVLAEAYLNAGKKAEAIRCLSRIPDKSMGFFPEETIQRAILEKRLGRHENAHRLFHGVEEAVLTDARALHEFAQTKMRLAEEVYRKQGAWSYKKDARRQLLEEAREMLQRLLQMDAPPLRKAWVWYNLGQVLSKQNAPREDVRMAFEEASRLQPGESRFMEALTRFS